MGRIDDLKSSPVKKSNIIDMQQYREQRIIGDNIGNENDPYIRVEFINCFEGIEELFEAFLKENVKEPINNNKKKED